MSGNKPKRLKVCFLVHLAKKIKYMHRLLNYNTVWKNVIVKCDGCLNKIKNKTKTYVDVFAFALGWKM